MKGLSKACAIIWSNFNLLENNCNAMMMILITFYICLWCGSALWAGVMYQWSDVPVAFRAMKVVKLLF